MKTKLINFIFLLAILPLAAQQLISGKVTDKKGNPIVGANVYLEGTYDGGSTNEGGSFSFETTEEGVVTLVVSMLSFEDYLQVGDVGYFLNLEITLKEGINGLNEVTLSAGTFEAGDNAKVKALKPLDVVTTAGAVGDFVAALQTLPGTTTVSEDGRLFVRGGSADETQVFIDGMRVFSPYIPTANNVPTRGRFSPFLFKGISFSTGGYSAEYGQALSSVLLLNTSDVETQARTDIGAMSVGATLGHTWLWDKSSVSVNGSYINLAPYESLLPSDQGARWNDPYESISGEAIYRRKGENSLFKLYSGFNRATLDIAQEDINFTDFVDFNLTNQNIYFNASHKWFMQDNWTLTSGASLSFDKNEIGIINDNLDNDQTAFHTKLKIQKKFNSRFALIGGVEYLYQDFEQGFTDQSLNSFESGFDDGIFSAFVEGDVFFNSKFALKLGSRFETTSLLDEQYFTPRLSLAHKTGKHGQFSLAYGMFYQNPINGVVQYDAGLSPEKTDHYLLNYQYANNGRTLRAEAYYKGYDDLVRYNTELPRFNSIYNNGGDGHAAGLDIFWRDNKTIKNLDYWLSYSYLDTERLSGNFPVASRPNFAPEHNLSLVTKYWADKLKSQIGLSYSYASGRPFNDLNSTGFNTGRTKAYNNVSVNWAYLIDQQKILFFSVNNILGFNNINNYQYSNTPNVDGIFDRRAVVPTADSFFFVGFFWTISDDRNSNQLDQL